MYWFSLVSFVLSSQLFVCLVSTYSYIPYINGIKLASYYDADIGVHHYQMALH